MKNNIHNNEIKTEANGSTDTVASNHLGDIIELFAVGDRSAVAFFIYISIRIWR